MSSTGSDLRTTLGRAPAPGSLGVGLSSPQLDTQAHARPILSPGPSVPTSAGAAVRSGALRTRALRVVVLAGSFLLWVTTHVLTGVKRLWKRAPHGVRRRVHQVLKSTGVPYVLSYIASYDERHGLGNFAGNLVSLNASYVSSSAEQRERLALRFDRIMDTLVMKNGVTKKTYPMRQDPILTQVLADTNCRFQKFAITVLEVPSSTGIASLANFATLSQSYRIRTYVLGDLFFHLYYDTDRECVFDDEFNLLQVKLKNRFFSIYRAERSGDAYSHLTAVLLFPFELASRHLRKKYAYSTTSNNVPILVLHPDVEARVRTGDLTVRKMDVFHDIGDRYDLILCFNLLVRDYFPPDQIAKGMENLRNALHDEGFLIMGDGSSFSVAQKIEGRLEVVKHIGRL